MQIRPFSKKNNYLVQIRPNDFLLIFQEILGVKTSFLDQNVRSNELFLIDIKSQNRQKCRYAPIA